MTQEVVKTFVVDDKLIDQLLKGEITSDDYMEKAERGPDLTITTENEEIDMDMQLQHIEHLTECMCNVYRVALMCKEKDEQHHMLPRLRTMYSQYMEERAHLMQVVVQQYKSHCRKCKGVGYFPQYAHINGGACFSCNNPQLHMNVIFKDINLYVTPSKLTTNDEIRKKIEAMIEESPIIPCTQEEKGVLVRGTYHMSDDID